MWRHQQIPSLPLAVCVYILNLYTLWARREYPLCIMAHCSREETGRVSNNPIDSPVYGLKHSRSQIYLFFIWMRIVASVLGPFYFVFYVCERIIWKAARRLSAGQSCYTTGLLIWITMPHCVSVWNIFQTSAHTQEQPIGESLCRWIIAVFVLSIEYYILPYICPKNINLQWILVFSIS
jgi:hypothetical protein